VKMMSHNNQGSLTKYIEYASGGQNAPTISDINYLKDKYTPSSICKSKMDLTHFYVDFTSEVDNLAISCNSNHINSLNLSNSSLNASEDYYYNIEPNETIYITYSEVSDLELMQPYILTINTNNSNAFTNLNVTCKLQNQVVQNSTSFSNEYDNKHQIIHEYGFNPLNQNNELIFEIKNNWTADIHIDDITFIPVSSTFNGISYNKHRMPVKMNQNQNLSKFIYNQDLKLQETRNMNEFLVSANTYSFIPDPLLYIAVSHSKPEVDTYLSFSIECPIEDPEISNVEWIVDETNTVPETPLIYKFEEIGEHNIKATITFQNNEIKTIENKIFVHPKLLNTNINVSPSGGYIGQFTTQVTLTIDNPSNLPTGNSIVECAWDVNGSNFFSDIVTTANGTFTFTPQNLGHVPIRVRFKDNMGNKGYAETEICVYKCQEDIDFVLQNTTVHYGETATFNIVNNGSCYVPQKYIWDFGDGTQKTETTYTNIQHSYDKPGIYNVTMQFYDQGYVLHTTTKSIEINNFPITATVNFPQGLNFEASTSMSLSNLLGGYGAYSVRWEYYLESTDTTLVTPTNIWLTVDQNNNTSAILNWNPEFCGNEVQLRCRIYDDVNSRTIYTSDFINVLGSGCFH